MPKETICKTVHQYNKEPVLQETMQKLQEIASDYCKVKNYVYQRYGGIKSLPKIYPGYTVQNEMTASGLRIQLGLPSVYFYLAVFDALGDIKNQWTQTKKRIQKCIKENSEFTPQDRHYLRFVLKMSACFESILLEEELHLQGEWKGKYDAVSSEVDVRKLNQYLCRQVRRHLKKMHTDTADGFSISEKAYRYKDHGIYIATKENRKRVFIPLTDNNHYKKQLYIILHPETGNLEIRVPVERAVKRHEDYNRTIGLAVGIRNMFVTDTGNVYGETYGEYQSELTEYVKQGLGSYRKHRKYNSGRKKYQAGKDRLEARLHTYINGEINRMLAAEKPKVIYVPRLPQSSKAGINKKINHSIGLWQRGYVRNRLSQKCREHSIELIEVFAKGISTECSSCGQCGERQDGVFTCPGCGMRMYEKENTARNVLKRGRSLKEEGFKT